MWHAPKDKGSLIILQSGFQVQVSLFLHIRNRVMFPFNAVSGELFERNDQICVHEWVLVQFKVRSSRPTSVLDVTFCFTRSQCVEGRLAYCRYALRDTRGRTQPHRPSASSKPLSLYHITIFTFSSVTNIMKWKLSISHIFLSQRRSELAGFPLTNFPVGLLNEVIGQSMKWMWRLFISSWPFGLFEVTGELWIFESY